MAFSPFVPLLAITSFLLPGTAPGVELYSLISTGLLGILFVYMFLGVIAYRKHPILWPIFLLLTPVAVVLHAVGALWGVVRPVEEFEVTEKVTADTIETVNQSLDDGELQNHDGTDRLLRESSDQYETHLFDD
jgi:hypothetical protein